MVERIDIVIIIILFYYFIIKREGGKVNERKRERDRESGVFRFSYFFFPHRFSSRRTRLTVPDNTLSCFLRNLSPTIVCLRQRRVSNLDLLFSAPSSRSRHREVVLKCKRTFCRFFSPLFLTLSISYDAC